MGKPDKKKQRTVQEIRDDLRKKYNCQTYEIGKKKQKCFVTFPNTEYRKKVSIGRKILHFNYAASRKITKREKIRITKMPSKEWHEEIERHKTLPFEERYPYGIHKRNTRRFRDHKELLESKKAHGILEFSTNKPPEPVDGNTKENTDLEETDEWKCANWPKHMLKDCLSAELNEIVSNMRVVGEFRDASKVVPPLSIVFLESVRTGLFSQDWQIVAKSMEGIFEEAVTRSPSQKQIVWNAGFLSVLRFTKNDKEKVKEFARIFKDTFRPKVYGRRLGNEVAIWLAQEGFFNESILFLEEMEITPKNGGYFHQPKYRVPFNPKRDLIDLMANLIRGVFLYSIWKRDSDKASFGVYEGSENDLRRSGENALSTFESLLELAEDCGAEVTTFLEPLIELTLEYRSAIRAKHIFKELVDRHHGNAFVEGAYLVFLNEHFPELKTEIELRKHLQNKFIFKPAVHWDHQSRAVAEYKKKKIEQMPERQFLKKIPNPGFSW